MSKYPRNVLHELAPGKVLTLPIIYENMKIALEAREDVDNVTKSVTKTKSEKIASAFMISPATITLTSSKPQNRTTAYNFKPCPYCNGKHYPDKCRP